jgi:hypothetical protein
MLDRLGRLGRQRCSSLGLHIASAIAVVLRLVAVLGFEYQELPVGILDILHEHQSRR